jgi:hypothetical protein
MRERFEWLLSNRDLVRPFMAEIPAAFRELPSVTSNGAKATWFLGEPPERCYAERVLRYWAGEDRSWAVTCWLKQHKPTADAVMEYLDGEASHDILRIMAGDIPYMFLHECQELGLPQDFAEFHLFMTRLYARRSWEQGRTKAPCMETLAAAHLGLLQVEIAPGFAVTKRGFRASRGWIERTKGGLPEELPPPGSSWQSLLVQISLAADRAYRSRGEAPVRDPFAPVVYLDAW